MQAILFAGVVVWEGLGAVLLWRPTDAAFVVTLALWGAFVLAEEIFLAYVVEATHLRLFIAQLVTLLVIHLLPDGSAS